MEQATPSGPATSASKKRPQARPLMRRTSSPTASRTSPRGSRGACPVPRPARRRRRRPRSPGVAPAASVPRQQLVDPARRWRRTGGSAAGARWWTTCRPGRTRASNGSRAHRGRARPGPPECARRRRHALGRRHDDGPGVLLPRPARSGHTRPDVDDALAVDEGAEGPAPVPEVRPPFPLAQTTVAPAPNVSATRSKPGATNPLTSSPLTAPAAPARRRATTPCATTTR